MRRLMTCVMGLVVLASILVTGARSPQAPARRVAVTIDDLPVATSRSRDLPRARQITTDLLAALVKHRVPAIGFVNENKLEDDGRVTPERVALLQAWIDAGLELGNHTYSHPDLHRVPFDDFAADLLKGERITRPLLEKAGRTLAWFRHPFLHTGRSLDIRQRVDALLKHHRYTVAPVTIDNYDYQFAAAYERAADAAQQQKIVDAYLDYMERIFAYYEAQSTALVGREISQTLLLHASALNARAFDALAARLASRGYEFISLARALEDPAYALPDTYVGAAGMTWLHRWAITARKPPGTFAGEPDVPSWIVDAGR